MSRKSRQHRASYRHMNGSTSPLNPKFSFELPERQHVPWFEDIDLKQKYIGKVKMRPSTAKLLIETSLDENLRKGSTNKAHVAFLLGEYRAGRWNPDSPDRLWFALSGGCINGQHRLEWITVLDGEEEYVIIGIETLVPLDARDHADSHTVRRLRHRIKLSDSPEEARRIETLLNTYQRIETGSTAKLSPAVGLEHFEKHYAAIMFAATYMGRRAKFTSAPVMVALMEMYGFDPVKATAFAGSLTKLDGPVQPARLLRDSLLRTPYAQLRDQLTVYNRAVSAMRAALEGRTLKVLYEKPKGGGAKMRWVTRHPYRHVTPSPVLRLTTGAEATDF